MMRLFRRITVLALIAAPLPAVAQQAARLPASTAAAAPAPAPATGPAELRRLAAGHRALTLCSAMFNARWLGARRSRSHVEAHDLVGIYPDLQPFLNDNSVVIAAHHVLVRDRSSGRRLALAYERTAGRGCSIARDGVPLAEVLGGALLPPPLIPAPAQWPQGDMILMTSPHRVLPVRDEAAMRADNVEQHRRSPFIDPALSSGPIARAFTPAYGAGINTTAIVVVRGGEIVGERYAAGFGIDVPQRTWSVAKSIAATIIGAAVQRGEVDINAPAAIADWRVPNDPRGAITLDHLLHMSSGLTSDTAGNRTDAIYFGGTTVDAQAPTWPLIAAPGSTFRYANNDSLLATLAIAPTFARHPPRAFFDSINMHATIAETDWRGNYVLSSQVWTTARDLARFGMLYLNNGEWNGRRILPENWRIYVSTPSGPQPSGPFGYGASFWLLNRSDGVPADTFAAFGNRGQFVVIVPSQDIVIVRRGEDPTGARFDIAAFTRDTLAAIDND